MGLTTAEMVRIKRIREQQASLGKLLDTEEIRERLEREAQAILDRATERVVAPYRELYGAGCRR